MTDAATRLADEIERYGVMAFLRTDLQRELIATLRAAASKAQEPVAWRVDGIRNGEPQVWFYWKPEWPIAHKEHGDKVTPLYATKSAPEVYGSLPSGESDPVVMQDYAGADTPPPAINGLDPRDYLAGIRDGNIVPTIENLREALAAVLVSPPADAEIREALKQSLPLLETLHSILSIGDARRTVFKVVKNVRAALERLSRTDAEEKAGKADEAGWLIEKDDPPVYAVLSDDFDEHWTDDAEKALRFARREDAQAYVDHIGWTSPPVRVVEHMWPEVSRPSPASARGEIAQKGFTVDTIMEAFNVWYRTLTVRDMPTNRDVFAQGYVAGWNEKETQADAILALRDARVEELGRELEAAKEQGQRFLDAHLACCGDNHARAEKALARVAELEKALEAERERCAKIADQVAVNAERRAADRTPQSAAQEAAYNKMEGAQEVANQIRARSPVTRPQCEGGEK